MAPKQQKARRVELSGQQSVFTEGRWKLGRSGIVVLIKNGRWVVSLSSFGRAERRVGMVAIDLAVDARRYGQDLVAELVEKALRELERTVSRPSRTSLERTSRPICRHS